MAVPKDMGISRANISGEHQIELELTIVAEGKLSIVVYHLFVG